MLRRSSKGFLAVTVSMQGVLSHAAAAGRNKDHIVAVVDVRRAYFTQSLSRRPSSSYLIATTWTPEQDAAGNSGVACTGRDRLHNVK